MVDAAPPAASGADPRPFRRLRRAAVIGCGLIGGSIAGALRSRGLAAQVVGFDIGADATSAQALGLTDLTAASLVEAVHGADLVVLAVPVPAMGRLLAAIRDHLADDALLIDCASTKRSTIEAARAAGGAALARFVACHPIAGGEGRGAGAASASLFEGRLAVLCPNEETDPALADRAHALWQALGARVARMDPETHDQLFAEVSHWPHAVAFALCGAIAAGPHAAPALQFAGAGLRDTTRIGASSADLWADILLDNREAVLACAEAFSRELAALTDALRGADRARLLERLEAASHWRRQLG